MRVFLVSVLLACLCLSAGAAVNRPADPVALTGADVPSLAGIAPGSLVAFAFDGGWTQIPVQVDERAVINFTQVYNGSTTYGSFSRLDYTDSGTFTGPDPDAALDANDEIVFMVKDAGEACPAYAAAPAGVVGATAVQVTLTDPVDGAAGVVYLFASDGTLDPAAGKSYVDYTFSLNAGAYKTNYKISAGPNPEDSFISTDFYERHFSDRWKSDGLRVFAGDATGVDILDRHKNLFAPGICDRSENTFSAAEGAFIVNKSGPVRALRGYVGANSGPRTQRTHVFYEQREDITTHLRVHAIPAIMDFLDYSPEASGMEYLNNNLDAPVVIDGVADTVPEGPVDWELARGPQGTILMLHTLLTDIVGLTVSSYYLDEANAGTTQCTGDAHAYGQSGHFIIGLPGSPLPSIPNTDPKTSPFKLLALERTIYYMPPDMTDPEGLRLLDNAADPLEVAAQPRAFDTSATVPDLYGMALAEAESALAVAGLAVGAVTEVFSATAAPGTVLGQSPSAGASAAPGSAVDLTVAYGLLGGILINNNRSATNTPAVSLSLWWLATGGPGVSRMRFSNDGAVWSAWERLADTRAYTLPAGPDGHRTVRVQYLDRANQRSAVFSDYIRLDTAPPTGAIVINNGQSATGSPQVTLGLSWQDGDGAGVTRMRFSNNGSTWSPWEPPAAAKAWTLGGTAPGYYTVRVQYRDGADNVSERFSDYIRLDP